MRFPWFDDHNEIMRREFTLRPVPGRDWWLLGPAHTKHKWAFDPNDPFGPDSELHWRSAILDAEGNAISLGLPKFANFGEWGPDSAPNVEISRAMDNGSAIFTVKHDGSLIIRSVHEGEVIVRTRGSAGLSETFQIPVLRLLAWINPLLLDPTFLPEYDLHFEYVGPQNQIVVKYETEELILVGATEKSEFVPVSWDELGEIAKAIGCRRVEVVRENLRDLTPQALHNLVSEWEKTGEWDWEGLVVRTSNAPVFMVKIKGADYLRRHRLRFSASYNMVALICLEEHVTNLEQLKTAMYARGMDWEVFVEAEEWFQTFQERKAKFDAEWQDLVDHVAGTIIVDCSVNDPNVDHRARRREFALAVKDHPRKSLCFFLYDGKREEAKQKLIEAVIME